jgi:hypothetical protein
VSLRKECALGYGIGGELEVQVDTVFKGLLKCKVSFVALVLIGECVK